MTSKSQMGSVIFSAKCVGFEPFDKVGPVIQTLNNIIKFNINSNYFLKILTF